MMTEIKPNFIAGDTDGLIKGKRYFTCPAKHGKIVRISSVVAVLPNKVSMTHVHVQHMCMYDVMFTPCSSHGSM